MDITVITLEDLGIDIVGLDGKPVTNFTWSAEMKDNKTMVITISTNEILKG